MKTTVERSVLRGSPTHGGVAGWTAVRGVAMLGAGAAALLALQGQARAQAPEDGAPVAASPVAPGPTTGGDAAALEEELQQGRRAVAGSGQALVPSAATRGDPPGTSEPAVSCTETAAGRLARLRYEQALVAEASADLGRASELYLQLVREHPETLFATWAQARLARLSAGGGLLNQEGRATFITSATLFGGWAGGALAAAFEVDSGEAAVLMILAGAGLGLVPSILSTGDAPMSSGRATLVTSSWLWGAYHGIGLAQLFENLDGSGIVAFGLLGSAAGFAGSIWGSAERVMTDGDAALISTATAWGAGLTIGLATLIGGERLYEHPRLAILLPLLGGDAALAAAALLREYSDMSAGRVALTSLGGLLGLLVSSGVLVLLPDDSPDPARVVSGFLVGGGLLGLAAGYWLTEGYDEPDERLAAGALFDYRREVGWRLGVPVPQLQPVEPGLVAARTEAGGVEPLAARGGAALRLSLPLAAGVW